MADDEDKIRKQQIKDTKARLALEKDIANTAERAHKSLLDYSQVKEKIRGIDKEILDLAERLAKAGEDEKEALQQELDTARNLSNELKKSLSLRKAIAKQMKTGILDSLSKQTQLLSGSLSMYYDIDEAVRKTSMSLGLSSSMMKTFGQTTQATAKHYTSLGLSSVEAAQAQATYGDELGRTVMLTEESLNRMANLGKLTGLGVDGVSRMSAQMESFGLGAKASLDYITDVADMSQGMGVNTGKVLKKTESSSKLLNKLNFRGGVKGLAKMAAYSEKFKMNMETIASSAESVFNPEGAIEAAANLQMMGGAFSSMADPFQMMYDARNNPEKYFESITNSLKGVAKFKDGEFIVSAYEMQRLEQAGKALGISKEEMVEMSKQKAKMDKLGGIVSFLPDKKDRDMLVNMIDLQKDGTGLINGKDVRELNKNELKNLLTKREISEEDAKTALSTREQFKALTNQLEASLLPAMRKFNDVVSPLIKSLSNFIENNPITSALITGGLIIGGKIAEWYSRGYTMGLGFNRATSSEKKGILQKLKDRFSGDKKDNVSNTISPQSDKITPTNKFRNKTRGTIKNRVGDQSGETPNTNGKQGGFLDKLKGVKPAQLLAVGGAMLMIGGALWIISDALVNLKAGNVGLEQFVGLGGMMVGMMGMMIPLVYALGSAGATVAIPLLALGAAFLMMGGAIWLATQGMAKLFESIGPNGDSIMKAGLGFIGMAAGVSILTASLIAMGMAAPLVGIGLIGLMGITTLLTDTAVKLDKANFGGVVTSINQIDTNKLSMLKDLVALSAKGKPIKVEFGDIGIDGDISLSGEGGGKSSTDWINDPTFVSKLKNIIMQELEKGKNGNAN